MQQLSKPEETQVESREVRKPNGDNHFKNRIRNGNTFTKPAEKTVLKGNEVQKGKKVCKNSITHRVDFKLNKNETPAVSKV